MIVVVADDLSGAAEVAGTALARGLSAEVQLQTLSLDTTADVVVVDTDSRPLPPEEAAEKVACITAPLRSLPEEKRPRWLFKKVDSVLRGPVLAELRALLSTTGLPRALLVPANPTRQRVIRRGRYLIAGLPLDQSSFARDPQHPARSSDVRKLLGAGKATDVTLLAQGTRLPSRGIAVGDAESREDLEAWARAAREKTLVAGAVDFFDAFLEAQEGIPRPELSEAAFGRLIGKPNGQKPWLFVCGSAAAWETARREQCQKLGIPVITMPEILCKQPDSQAIKAWSEEIGASLRAKGVVLAAIGSADPVNTPPERLADYLADAVQLTFSACPPSRLCIEGGATSVAVVRRLGHSRLTVCEPFHGGVVGVRPKGQKGPLMSLKPGSYPWPQVFWNVTGTTFR